MSAEPSSYIATTTAAVVRNGDVLQYQAATNIDSTLGSAYVEEYLPVLVTATQQNILSKSGHAPLYHASSPKELRTFTSAATVATANLQVIGSVNKCVSAWGGVTTSLCLNGGVVASGAYLNSANTGSIDVSAAPTAVKGTLRNLKFYNVRIADADLITMTA